MSLLDRRIGRNLQTRRRQCRMSRAALAEALKVTPADIVRYESGHKRIGPYRLWRLSEIMCCPLSCFFGNPSAVPEEEAPTQSGLSVEIRAQALALARAYYLIGDFRAQVATP